MTHQQALLDHPGVEGCSLCATSPVMVRPKDGRGIPGTELRAADGQPRESG